MDYVHFFLCKCGDERLFISPSNESNIILKSKGDINLYEARHNKVVLSIIMRMLMFGCWLFKEVSLVKNMTAKVKVLQDKL